jgi:hypothetical protein
MSAEASVTLSQLELMRHAVAFPGHNANTRKYRYRNYFACGPGEDGTKWDALVAAGFAIARPATTSDMVYYHVTAAGLRLIGDTRKDYP